MDSPSPETLEQLRAENQRLRAQIASFEAHGEPAPPIAGFAPYGPPSWFEAVRDAIIVLDATWHIQYWNQAATQIYGWPRVKVVGQPIAEIIPVVRDTNGARAESALRALTADGTWRGEIRPHTRDGRSVVIDASVHAFADDQGVIVGYIAIHRDITDRIHAETALHTSEERLVLALDAAQLIAWEWDIAAGTLTYSPHVSDSFPIPPGALAATIDDLRAKIYPPDLPRFVQALEATLQSNAPAQLQVRMRTPDGTLCWLELHGRAQYDASRQPVRVVGVTRDISAEKQREADHVARVAIGRALSATHDVAATLQALIALALPDLADSCAIFLLDDAAMIVPATAYAGEPPQSLALADLPPPVPLADATGLLGAVLRDGDPRLLAAAAPDLAPWLGAYVPRSALLLPLVDQGRVLGVLQLGRTAHPYAADDLALAQHLARHGALALVRARLQESAQAAQQVAGEALARLDSIFTRVPAGVAYLDGELRAVLVNPALAAISGGTPAELHGRPLAEVLPRLAPQLEPLMCQVLATGEAMRNRELRDPPDAPDVNTQVWTISIFPATGPTGAGAGIGMTLTDITHYRRTEAALRASTDRFRLLAEHARDVIYRFGLVPTLMLEYFSPAIEDLTGYPREAFYQDPDLPRRLIHPDDTAFLSSSLMDFMALPQPLIVRWLHQDGTTKWAELHSWLVTDEAGQPLAMEGIARDITARTQAEEALRASQQNLMTLIENTDGLIWSVDRQYRLLVGNGLFQRYVRTVLGRDPVPGDEMVALSMPQVLLDEWRIYYDRALAGEAFSVEVPTRLSAEPRTGEYRLSPIRTATGVITGVTIFGRDITARQRADRALQETERKLGTLFALLPVGIAIFDAAGAVVYVNPALEQIMRMDRANLFNGVHLARHYLRADGAPMPPEEYARVRASYAHEVVTNLEIGYITETGATIWTSISAVPVDFPDWRMVMVTIDITARKQAEAVVQAHAEALSRTNAELTHALRLKDEFLAMMSHELRTPLSVVLGISEAMEESLYGPINGEQRRALETVMQSGRHLLAILSDILDLAHLEAGHATLERQIVEVDILCQSALQFVQAAAQQKGIHLRRSMEQGVDRLRADERRLTQILVNLLDNAIKFTPAGGIAGLEVSADPAQERIQFVVWDTGIGIAEDDYARLFQPFTQLDGTLSRSYGGVGLGLTLVRRLVDLHGGSIRLESTLGQGSRFMISLPWVDGEHVAPLARIPTPPPQPWTHPLRVVLAEDHEPTLAFYLDMLTKQGTQVAVARTGEEALAQVRASHPDVAVLDIQMPGMDGLEAIRHIRADPAVATVPIIALTALTMPGDRERCLAAGASAYLAKPVSFRTLVATIAEVLTGAEARPT